jgi:predicted regulator of Ras-like GTPase activity (Roadblock/LC7/MglB family)
MFGFLKNLMRKPQGNQGVSTYEPVPDEVASDAEPESPVEYTPPPPVSRAVRPAPASRPAPQPNGKGVELSLQNILNGLPLELQPRVRQPDVGSMTISVPLEKILAQLSRGAVKVSFGELRQAAPEVFTLENDRDRVLVSLPLGDILSRLNPALITRRRVQKQVEVPAEISSPFDENGQGLAISGSHGGPAAQPVAPAPVRQKAPPPPPPVPAAPARTSLTSAPTPPPPSAAIPAVPLRPKAPAASLPPVAPIPVAPLRPKLPVAPPTPAPAPPIPVVPLRQKAAPVQPPQPLPPAPLPMPAPAPVAASAPAPSVSRRANGEDTARVRAASPQPANLAEPLVVGLASLAEDWPDDIKQELLNLKLIEAVVALPASAVEQALKQGRISFSWKTLRSWVKPAILLTPSAHDGVVLELPLKVVAPLFLSRQQEAAKQQQKITVDEEIPNLFFGFPQAEPSVPVAAATARPADTNFYVWDETSDTARVDRSDVKRNTPGPGTRFVEKYATPNEVVSRAAGLDGVVGALIALPDGLMVANRLPAELNADTLAAFLPQIFGKVSQCTKELRMGELNNLNFTVGNVPWKIFRVHSIFFAAFGKAGEPLPTAQLAALAAELDHKPR